MRILIYGDNFNDNSGFAKEIRNFIPTFLENGHEVAQVALNYSGLPPRNYKIRMYPTKIMGVRSYWAPEILDVAIDDFKPDIVFTVGDYFMLPHIVSILTKPRMCKWIHWGVVDGDPMRKEYAVAASWANWNLTQSKYGADVLKDTQKKVFKNSQAEVFYPPIDLDNFKKLNIEPLREKFKTKDRFTVLFVGRNQYRKNTPVLLEAISKLRKVITNIQLLLHSTPTVSPNGVPDGFDLTNLVADMDLQEYVASVKSGVSIPESVMTEIYNSADCLCMPSFGEGFGLPIAEAMACEIPVIANKCSSMTELLEGDRGMLVKPAAHIWQDGYTKHQVLNSDNLANAIKSVWENPVLREKYIENGKTFVQGLEMKSQGEKLLNIFEKVLKENPVPIAKED